MKLEAVTEAATRRRLAKRMPEYRSSHERGPATVFKESRDTAMTTRVPSRPAPIATLLASAFACTAIAWAAMEAPKARVVYNATDSVPIGWYGIETANGPLVGRIVLAELPAKTAALAAQRGYLPARVPLLKRVGAMAPQHVCTVDGTVHIDGVPVAVLLSADRLGRPLPSWTQCRRLLR